MATTSASRRAGNPLQQNCATPPGATKPVNKIQTAASRAAAKQGRDQEAAAACSKGRKGWSRGGGSKATGKRGRAVGRNKGSKKARQQQQVVSQEESADDTESEAASEVDYSSKSEGPDEDGETLHDQVEMTGHKAAAAPQLPVQMDSFSG